MSIVRMENRWSLKRKACCAGSSKTHLYYKPRFSTYGTSISQRCRHVIHAAWPHGIQDVQIKAPSLTKAQIPLGPSRHDTLSSPCILAQEKVVTCCVALVGRRNSHDTCLGASPQRGVGWTCPSHVLPEVVPEIDANPEHKRLNLYTREHCCFFVVRHIGTIKHGATHTTSATRSSRRARHARDVTQQVEFGLIESAENATCCMPKTWQRKLKQVSVTKNR